MEIDFAIPLFFMYLIHHVFFTCITLIYSKADFSDYEIEI